MTATITKSHQCSDGVGGNVTRPDAIRKVSGEFAYSSDLWHDDMIWGATLRSPHPHARVHSINVGKALAIPGVCAVLTHQDVPGTAHYGLFVRDQPVLAIDLVRHEGEPVALVAADHPETARRAADEIVVNYEPLAAITDAEAALHPGAAPIHENGNIVRWLPVRKGESAPSAPVVVSGVYEVGMQDQAFLGPESGLAVPSEDGGVELFVASQGLHDDQPQVADALGLPLDKVRLTLAGVGGAFGGREDISVHIHASLLALHTGRPVKMVYNRYESFFGHVHRHPARMHYEHGADRDGRLIYVNARLVLDGGAYASSTMSVVGNAATLGIGPYVVPNVNLDCYGVYTHNPPCGAMRGFGAVQAAFGYESQMDKLADELAMDPMRLRILNALDIGETMPTGQRIDSAAPVAQILRRLQNRPLPPAGTGEQRDLPGGVANTTHGEGVRRGIGYAVGVKNSCFSEGTDDSSTARVRLEANSGHVVASVQTAAAEVGQGLVTVLVQIVRTELGVDQVVQLPADTSIASAGSTSASRQTYMTGGAVKSACERVRTVLLERAQERFGSRVGALQLDEDGVVTEHGTIVAPLSEILQDGPVDETVTWHHPPTRSLNPETGQGDGHVQYAFAAHRAVVDVDVDLGVVKVIELACVQDVGKALNPSSVAGQIHGGSAQGLGLAVMEEIQVDNGRVRNPSFTDYLIPTMLDMPPMSIDVLELADPAAPYGVRGVGEAPTISSTPAIVAAIRQATGCVLTRVPVRPSDVVAGVSISDDGANEQGALRP